jgi:putative transposase
MNPTPEQETYFRKAAGTARFVYNWGLNQWNEQYQAGGKPSIKTLKEQFNAIKREQFPFVVEVAKDVAENAFINLGKSFTNFFDSVKGKRSDKVGYPKFKNKKRSKASFGLNNDKFHVDGHNLYVPRLGLVNMAETLRFVGKIMSGTVSCVAGNWYISITVEIEQPVSVQFKEKSVGIDFGVKTLATLSNEQKYENQALLRKELNELKRLNRQLSRRVEGSNRWYKTKQKLAEFHERIKAKRLDFIHKMTTGITRTFERIGLETLNIKGMVRNRKLALSISDASMGEVVRQIEYKSQAAGGKVVKVGRFYASSKTCHDCGAINQTLTLSDRTWTCQSCGTIQQRDWNAAKNIEQEALRLAYA